MLRRILWLFLLMALIGSLFFGQPGVSAQGAKATVINYGDIVTGTITNDVYQVDYRFTGSAGDVIIAQLGRYYGDDSSAPTLDQPMLILTDPSGTTSQIDGYGTAVLALQLTTDGEHLLTATRTDGATGTSVGAFQLALYKPEELVTTVPVTASITNEQTVFYWISATDELRLSYQRTEGTFAPEVAIVTPSDYGLVTVGLFSGNLVESASLDIRLPSTGLYFVRLTEGLLDFNFEPVEAEYTLELIVRKGLPITNQ